MFGGKENGSFKSSEQKREQDTSENKAIVYSDSRFVKNLSLCWDLVSQDASAIKAKECRKQSRKEKGTIGQGANENTTKGKKVNNAPSTTRAETKTQGRNKREAEVR